MATTKDPFPASEFDDWAETYDASVAFDQFPFFGYEQVLRRIVRLAEPRRGLTVLDLGTGTGNLSLPFARLGCDLWCSDFSEPMLARARRKLPEAHFCLHDLRTGLPPELDGPFDRIVSAYVFHHFELNEKVRILNALAPHLKAGGRIVIGDIAFPDAARMEAVKAECGEAWEEEFYWLADESLQALGGAGLEGGYEQVSRCAGVFHLTRIPPGTNRDGGTSE